MPERPPHPQTLSAISIPIVPVGERLANGATVLAASAVHPNGDGFVAHGYIACVTAEGAYATWVYRMNTQSAHSGTYHARLDDALAELRRRCERAGLAIVAGG
jgi:hypothetical protein